MDPSKYFPQPESRGKKMSEIKIYVYDDLCYSSVRVSIDRNKILSHMREVYIRDGIYFPTLDVFLRDYVKEFVISTSVTLKDLWMVYGSSYDAGDRLYALVSSKMAADRELKNILKDKPNLTTDDFTIIQLEEENII